MRAEEGLGPQFNWRHYWEARKKAIAITQELAHSLAPGLYESEAHELLQQILKRHGIEKLWHPNKIRLGRNTLCTFRDPSPEDVRLNPGELFFVDIGPVVQGHEGDYGETFLCGGGSDPLIEATRKVFRHAEENWKKKGLTGVDLFQVASLKAQELGYKLDRRSAGHRCGDFPHALHHKGKLFDFSHTPSRGLWILEIHLIDETRERGAFFEDVLGGEDPEG